MSVISMKQLLEAGVHFDTRQEDGIRRWRNISYGKERHIHYDLQKTVKKVEEAYNFIKEVVASGKDILFVGTKSSSGVNRIRGNKS